MQCSNSSMMLGNLTLLMTSASCSVTSCSYLRDSSVVSPPIFASFRLTTTLKPQCPGPHKFPPLIPPPTSSFFETYLGPSPTPTPSEGGINPTIAGMAPTSSPAASSGASPTDWHVSEVLGAFALCIVANMLW